MATQEKILQIAKLYRQGYTVSAISARVEVPTRRLDKIFQRDRKKAKMTPDYPGLFPVRKERWDDHSDAILLAGIKEKNSLKVLSEKTGKTIHGVKNRRQHLMAREKASEPLNARSQGSRIDDGATEREVLQRNRECLLPGSDLTWHAVWAGNPPKSFLAMAKDFHR